MQSRAALTRRRVGWVLIGASLASFAVPLLGGVLVWDPAWNQVARYAATALIIAGIVLIGRADRFYDRGQTVPFDDELDDDRLDKA